MQEIPPRTYHKAHTRKIDDARFYVVAAKGTTKKPLRILEQLEDGDCEVSEIIRDSAQQNISLFYTKQPVVDLAIIKAEEGVSIIAGTMDMTAATTRIRSIEEILGLKKVEEVSGLETSLAAAWQADLMVQDAIMEIVRKNKFEIDAVYAAVKYSSFLDKYRAKSGNSEADNLNRALKLYGVRLS